MNRSLDSMRYAYGTLVGEEPLEHAHVLAKDPQRLGWKCEVAGCGFFKPAGEFDGIRLAPGVEWRDEA